MNVTLRQLREVASRLLWCMGYPPGFEQVALRLVIYSQLEGGDGLLLLWREVEQGYRLRPDAVKLVRYDAAAIQIDGGYQSIIYLAAIALDVALEKAGRDGSAVIIIEHSPNSLLGRGLAALAVERGAETAFCEACDSFGQSLYASRVGSQPPGHKIPGSIPEMLSGISRVSLTVANLCLEKNAANLTMPSDGYISVDPDLWDRAFARSQDVLLARKRRQFSYAPDLDTGPVTKLL